MVELTTHYSNPEMYSDYMTCLTYERQKGSKPSPVAPPASTLEPQRRLSKAEIDEMVEIYQQGSSVPQVAAQFQIHRATVMTHLKRRGVDRRPSQPKLTAKQTEQAAKLYDSGASLIAVGHKFNVSANTVRSHFIKQNIPLRERRGWNKSK